ncbi:MAG: T9SS type A sorting domain-containing protein [Bacteroidota bacterium]
MRFLSFIDSLVFIDLFHPFNGDKANKILLDKMKQFFTSIFICLTLLASAQTFTEVPDVFENNQVQSSARDLSDFDGDGDIDLLLIGEKSFSDFASVLYENVDGEFIELINTPFVDVTIGSVRFGDIDGDDDEDAIIMGLEENNDYSCRVYRNDMGVFTEVESDLPGLTRGAIEFSDVDGDGDLDLFLLGEDIDQNYRTELYENTDGVFSLVEEAIFEGLALGDLDVGDVDGDGDDDLIMCGQNNSNQRRTLLYINTNGVFTESAQNPFHQVDFSFVNFHDYDGDNDLDLLLCGQVNFFDPRTTLYENTDGLFSEVEGANFTPLTAGMSHFGDFDNDGDDDLIIIGQTELSNVNTTYYIYEAGEYTEVIDNGLVNVANGAVVSSDFDGDGDLDIVISGRSGSSGRTGYYSNGVITSTSDLIAASGVRLFPNPTATDRINLEFKGIENGWINIQIFDITGRLLDQNPHYVVSGYQNIEMNLSEYSQGIYLLQLGGVTRRFIVE